jgi:hypothetical protein
VLWLLVLFVVVPVNDVFRYPNIVGKISKYFTSTISMYVHVRWLADVVLTLPQVHVF